MQSTNDPDTTGLSLDCATLLPGDILLTADRARLGGHHAVAPVPVEGISVARPHRHLDSTAEPAARRADTVYPRTRAHTMRALVTLTRVALPRSPLGEHHERRSQRRAAHVSVRLNTGADGATREDNGRQRRTHGRQGWQERQGKEQATCRIAHQVDDMKVVVDFSICDLHGLCVEAAPEVFQIGDDGALHVLNETPEEGLRAKVDRAVRECPTGAIWIEE